MGWGLSYTSHKTWGEGLEEVTRLGARSWRSHKIGCKVLKKSQDWVQGLEEVTRLGARSWRSHKIGCKVLKKSQDWVQGLEEVTRLGARSWRSHNMVNFNSWPFGQEPSVLIAELSLLPIVGLGASVCLCHHHPPSPPPGANCIGTQIL